VVIDRLAAITLGNETTTMRMLLKWEIGAEAGSDRFNRGRELLRMAAHADDSGAARRRRANPQNRITVWEE
jgi:hypothetical protein